MPQRLPRFYAHLQRVEDERKIGEILREGGEVESEPGTPLRRSADGHNRDRRRGLPVVSKGIGGASPAQTRSLRCSPKRPGPSAGAEPLDPW